VHSIFPVVIVLITGLLFMHVLAVDSEPWAARSAGAMGTMHKIHSGTMHEIHSRTTPDPDAGRHAAHAGGELCKSGSVQFAHGSTVPFGSLPIAGPTDEGASSLSEGVREKPDLLSLCVLRR
jgi:hypothetical protein